MNHMNKTTVPHTISALKQKLSAQQAQALRLDKLLRLQTLVESFSESCPECSQTNKQLQAFSRTITAMDPANKAHQKQCRTLVLTITRHLARKHHMIQQGFYISIGISIGIGVGCGINCGSLAGTIAGSCAAIITGVIVGIYIESRARKQKRII